MISLMQNAIKGEELLARKLLALEPGFDPAICVDLQLDSGRLLLESGSKLFMSGSGHLAPVVLIAGVAGEIRILKDGRRQIIRLQFPGDILHASDGETQIALTRVCTGDGRTLMSRLADASEVYRPLRRALINGLHTDQRMMRDHVVRLGCMSAIERLAHMLLEVHERLAQIGLTRGPTFHLPLTQDVLADVVGLSVVHLNRTLQSLRRDGLILTRHGYITLLDRPRLIAASNYASRFPRPWREDEDRGAWRGTSTPVALAS